MDNPIITSTRNPRVVEARKLNQRKHRQQQNRFLVEGLQLLHMALDGGWQPVEVFYSEPLMTGTTATVLLSRFEQAGASLLSTSADVLRALSERENPQGIVATFTPQEHLLNTLPTQGLFLVLDRLQDPGNFGTLLRTADAVGASGVIMITPATDPFDPKTVRASMGSLFNIPVVSIYDVASLFHWLESHHIRPVGADAHRGQAWTQTDWSGAVALVLGNEARGLSDDTAAYIQEWTFLPIHGKADSLNVAIAGGVLMYNWVAGNY